MRLATIRTTDGTRAVRVDDDYAVETGHIDVGALLKYQDWPELSLRADGPRHSVTELDYAPVVPQPGKVICLGLNYTNHIREMGRELPQHPTLFAKYPQALIGAYDRLTLPAASSMVDWEAELAVVVGAAVRNADRATARQAIAGYAVFNDVTARDWQYRAPQWLQGKTFEATTPFGPHLVTADEIRTSDGEDPEIGLDLECLVDESSVQHANTADMVFDAVAAISYVSTILTLHPGDVLALGTPGGVGHARVPPRYLQPGQTLLTRISGLGECRNLCEADTR
jgi:acylpyruvate hydrolase